MKSSLSGTRSHPNSTAVHNPGTAQLTDHVVEQLEALIRATDLVEGTRLPAERQLAAQFNVSRSCLREAIQRLISRGVLVAKRGGGTFIAPPADTWSAQAITGPLAPLLQTNPHYRFDILEIRHALEGSAAYYAALRATEADKQRIRDCFNATQEIQLHTSPPQKAMADTAFHLAIANASHNLVLSQVMSSLFDLLETSISRTWEQLYEHRGISEELQKQHHELMTAIISGDAERAKTAAEQHLTFVEVSLKQVDEYEARLARSSQTVPSIQPGMKIRG